MSMVNQATAQHWIRGLMLAVGIAFSCAASSQALDPSFGTYRAPEGIDCAQSPFGARLTLGADEEPLVTRRNAAAGSILFSQHSGNNSGLLAERTRDLTTLLGTSVSQVESLALDFNGDGESEVAQATRRAPPGSPDRLTVSMFRRCQGVCEFPLEPRGEWRLDPVGTEMLLDFALGKADFDPAIGGDELIVASRWSNNTVRVFVLRGGANSTFLDPNNSGLARATYTHTAAEADDLLRMAVGDVLLEGRKQIILLTRVNNPVNWRYRLIRYTGGVNQDNRLSMQSFQWPRAGTGDRALGLYAGDLGGSAADELIMQQQDLRFGGVTVESPRIRVHYFTTQRDANNQITGVTFRRDTIDGIISVSSEIDRTVSFAIGELDRRPPQELVALYRGNVSFEPTKMRIEGYRVVFDTAGFPTGIALSQPQILGRIDLASSVQAVAAQALAVGDANGDGIGDAYVAVNQGSTSRLIRLSMLPAAGSPDGPADTTTFGPRGSFTYTDGGSTSSFGLVLGDFDFDSVLARRSTICRRVQEPTLRSLVMLPPSWSQLRNPESQSEAGIGEQGTSGGSTETRFSRFQSHDVSGYIGVQVDGEAFGIGAKGSAKVTFGYNFQAERGEVRGSSVNTTVTEGRSLDTGRGLVVLEENQFDCYDYDVTRGGVLAPNSDLRACERLSQSTSVLGTSLDDWNSFRAVTTTGATRAQWVPLEPDWASIALFRTPTGTPGNAANTTLSNATDGRFDTQYVSEISFTFPYLQIDLGEVRDLSLIRIHKPLLSIPSLSLFLSENPMVGPTQPSGPGVIRIDADPRSGNGLGSWDVRLLGPSPAFAPLRARYVRVQSVVFLFLPINEVQIFASDHLEPPSYPAAVCDDNLNDEVFSARVADMFATPPAYRTIQIRGRLQWLGTNENYANCGAVASGIPRPNIWGTTTVGAGTSATTWDLFQGTSNIVGVSNSISHSVRAGAELEFEAGATVQAIGGGAYEWSTGVTTEQSSTMEWGTGLNYSGSAGGVLGGSNPLCGFRTHPYAYVRTERSNIGYRHQFTMVDYFVPDVPNWSRLGVSNRPPQNCFPPRAEPIFGSGFEP